MIIIYCANKFNYQNDDFFLWLTLSDKCNISWQRKFVLGFLAKNLDVCYSVKKEGKGMEENKIEKLQEDLKLAIKEERYEDAAKIRDEIKKMSK